MPHGVLGDELSWRVPSPGSCLGGGEKRETDSTLRKSVSESSSFPCPRAAVLSQAYRWEQHDQKHLLISSPSVFRSLRQYLGPLILRGVEDTEC